MRGLFLLTVAHAPPALYTLIYLLLIVGLTVDVVWIRKRIEKTKALIEAVEDAKVVLVAGNVKSYTLNTGQSVQTVTRNDLGELDKLLDSYYNRIATLEARITGGHVARVAPRW